MRLHRNLAVVVGIVLILPLKHASVEGHADVESCVIVIGAAEESAVRENVQGGHGVLRVESVEGRVGLVGRLEHVAVQGVALRGDCAPSSAQRARALRAVGARPSRTLTGGGALLAVALALVVCTAAAVARALVRARSLRSQQAGGKDCHKDSSLHGEYGYSWQSGGLRGLVVVQVRLSATNLVGFDRKNQKSVFQTSISV